MHKHYRILLVEDHEIFRNVVASSLRKSLKAFVSEADNDRAAIELLEKEPWDLVLLDLRLKRNTEGMTILKRLAGFPVPPPVIVLSYANYYLDEALEYGIKGYLIKEATMDEIRIAIKVVLDGGTYYTESIYPADPGELTKLEIQVLRLLGLGNTSRQISKKLQLGSHTVTYIRKILMDKTQSATVAGLVRYALAKGYMN